MEESDKATGLKKAYAEMILNTAKESAARVMASDRTTARFHHDLCGTKDEAFRLVVRLKQMIDAKTIEAEITSSNQQRQIDELEAQLHEAEEIVIDLRSELRWVRDQLVKARQTQNVVNKEQETISSQNIVVGSDSIPIQSSMYDEECGGSEAISAQTQNVVNKEQETISAQNIVVGSDSLPNQSSMYNDECGGSEAISAPEFVANLYPNQENEDKDISVSLLNQCLLYDDECENCEKQFDGFGDKSLKASESELDTNIRNKKLELSRKGCTQRIHALETKPSSSANEEQGFTTDKDKEENLSSVNTRGLVLALRASNAEVIPLRPSNELKIKKSRKRRRRGWSKRKATLKKHLSVENEDVDAENACKGMEEHVFHNADGNGTIRKGKRSKNMKSLSCISSPVKPSDHMVETSQESNLVSVNGEDKAHILQNETTVVTVNTTNQSNGKDLLVKGEGEEDSVIPTTKMGFELVNSSSNLKAFAAASNRISEAPRADGNRLMMYTFQRKRKKDLQKKTMALFLREEKENNAEDAIESSS